MKAEGKTKKQLEKALKALRQRIADLEKAETERVLTEKALRESEERYRTIFEHAVEGIFQATPEGSYLSVNPAWAKMCGFSSPEEMIREVTDIAHQLYVNPDDRTKIKRLYEDPGVAKEFEAEFRRKDGGVIWVSITARSVRDENGNILYYEGMIEDITQRKQAEKALRESEEKYRILVEHANEGILVAQDGMLRYVNPRLLEFSGYSHGEITSRPFTDFIHPDDREMVLQHHLRRLKGEEVPKRYLFRIIDKDGQTRWIENDGVLTTWEGRPATFNFLTDVTERKHAEEESRRRDSILAALGTASEQLWESSSLEEGMQEMLERLGQATGVSRSYVFENHFGEDGTHLTSQRFEWVAPGVKGQRNNPHLRNFPWISGGMGRWMKKLTQGTSVHGHVKDFPPAEQEILRPQGILSVMVVPIFIGRQWWGFIGFDECLVERTWSAAEMEGLKVAARTLGTFIQRIQAEEKLRQNQEQLRSLASQLSVTEERERRRLATDLHDSVGQTLAMSKLRLDELRSRASSAVFANDLGHVSGLLDRALQGTRSLTFELSPPVLYELGIEAALESLVERMQQVNGIQIKLVDRGGPKPLSEDTAVLCFRAVQELLVNVLKHAHARKIEVSTGSDRDRIRITVADDGIGFDASEGISRKGGKGGFGLFSIRERLQHLGGSLKVDSNPGQGTRVTLSAPLKRYPVRKG